MTGEGGGVREWRRGGMEERGRIEKRSEGMEERGNGGERDGGEGK